MRVLHILNELRPSGAEMMLHIAAPFWKEHGIECGVLATAEVVGPFADELAAAGYAIHHIPRVKRPSHFFAVSRLIKQQKYSVVHQHLEGSGYWYSSAALAAGAGVVRTIHSNFLFSGWLRIRRTLQRRHLAYRGVQFAVIGPGVQENEQKRFHLQTHLVINWVSERFMARPSEAERQEARRMLGFTEDEFVLLSLGTCSNVKNHSLILQALARCVDLPRLRYLHVGLEEPGEPERELARELGVQDRVIFAGFKLDQMPSLYAADAYIQPSLYEGLSLASIEVLGTGLPGLFSDVPGLRDNAKFFPSLIYFSLSPEDVEQAIRLVMNESSDARKKRTTSYPEIAKANFSPMRGVSDYANLYHQALRSRKRT